VIVAIVALVIFAIYWYRTRYYKPLIEGVVALDRSQELQSLTIIQNTESVKPYAGTLKPIPISEFGTHVKRMHANDDYLFSEEYTVSEIFPACDLQRMVPLD